MKWFVILYLSLILLHGCVGGNSGSQSSSAGISAAGGTAAAEDVVRAITTAPVEIRQLMFDYIEDEYLWYSDLPSVDLTDQNYADLYTLLGKLRKVPEDRFSNLANAINQSRRYQQGVSGTFGFRYTIRNEEPLEIRITSVDDFSSVAEAGIKRGDQVIAINDQLIATMDANSFSEVLFADRRLGVQHNLSILHPDGSEGEYQITRTEHELSPVRQQRIFDDFDSGRRVGYVQVEEFIGRTATQLPELRAGFVNEAIDDLILDLRYNGGGYVSVSRDLASSVYGQSQSQDIYTVLRYNDKNRANDITFPFLQFSDALTSLQRVFILTTSSTCSASEEVINGLRPFMEVVTIGTTTCGKPYASTQFELIPGLVNLNILDARSVNASGEGDFYNGLAPVCEVQDDPVLPFSDPNESLIGAALFYAENNRCADDANRTVLSSRSKLQLEDISDEVPSRPVYEDEPAHGALTLMPRHR